VLAACVVAIACIGLALMWRAGRNADSQKPSSASAIAAAVQQRINGVFGVERPSIAPGQEELFAAMLGRGIALPDACALTAGQIERSVVRGVYQCAGAEVVVELVHPATAPFAAARTEKLAIVTAGGTPPPALLGALEERIRARESAFEWLQPAVHAERIGVDANAAVSARANRFATAPGVAWWIVPGKTLFIILFVGIAVALWRSRHRLLAGEAVPLLLLSTLALLLRAIATGGPADIREVIGDGRAERGGFVVFSQLVYAVLPPIDESLWAVHRLCGALAVPLLYAVVRKRFGDPLIAFGAASALAVTPFLVRFSASDTPYIPLCAAFLGALVAYDRYTDRPAPSTLALALGLLTAAMQLRPDGVWLLVPAALLALAGPLPPWSALFRPAAIACAIAFVVINAVPVVVSVTGHAGGGYLGAFVLVGSLYGSPWVVPAMTPLSLALLVVIGAVAALGYGRAGILWLAATLVADPINFPADGALGNYANARYHIPAMYLACGLIGIGAVALMRLFARMMRREIVPTPRLALAVSALITLAALPRFDLLWHMWTPQREFEFFRAGVARVDPGCQLVTLAYTRDAGWVPFSYLVPEGLVDIPEFLDHPRDGCSVYYRPANCYSGSLDLAPPDYDVHPSCQAIERRFRLEPILEAQLPAEPFRGERYVRDPLPVGFYRLSAPNADGEGASQRTN
jgi:hypothetical protein